METIRMKNKIQNASMSNQHQFTINLFSLLNHAKFPQTISWTDDRKQFQITNPKAFSRRVLPQHFGVTNFRDFLTTLHSFGFQRVTDAEYFFTFSKSTFTQDNSILSSAIKSCRNRRQYTNKEIVLAVQENEYLENFQKNMKRRIDEIEDECRTLEKKKQDLIETNKKLSTNENILKTAICSLGALFGLETVREVVQSAAQEMIQENQAETTVDAPENQGNNLDSLEADEIDSLDMALKDLIKMASFDPNERVVDVVLDVDSLAPSRYQSNNDFMAATEEEFENNVQKAYENKLAEKKEIEKEDDDEWLRNGLSLIGKI